MLSRIEKIVTRIRENTDFIPRTGIILGSGLDCISDSVDVVARIPYSDLPGMPMSTAPGHKGEFILGYISSKPVILMRGRIHYYEGYTPQEIVIPVRVMGLLGIRRLFVSNASGGVDPTFHMGDLMVIKDHVNFIPNPLIGPNIDKLGTRFPPMHGAYDPQLRETAKREAAAMGLDLKEGVYVALTGPSFETCAEYVFVRTIGGSCVGMSTTPEVIAANHMGIKVLAISLITNVFSPDAPTSGEEVLRTAAAAAGRMSSLFERIIAADD